MVTKFSMFIFYFFTHINKTFTQNIFMKQKLAKKCVNLINGNYNVNFGVFRFCEIVEKPRIKGNYCNKIFKKGLKTKRVVVIAKKDNNNPKNSKIVKTNLNQFNVVCHYKQKQLFNNNMLTKNVFFLNKKQNKILRFLSLILIGLVIGFVNGFWGGGGGMICVPTLTLILGLPDKKAHATAILIMLPLSVSSFIVYTIKGTVDYVVASIVSGGFVLGGVIGAILLKKANNVVIQIIFAIVIIAGAIKILI